MNNTQTLTPHRIIWLVRILFIAGAVFYLWQMDWRTLFIVLQGLLVSFSLPLFKRWFDIFIPYSLQAGIVLFMFGSLFLGEVGSFYTTFWWWDIVLHGFATVGLTTLGFILLFQAFSSREIKSAAILSSFLAFSIAMTMAVIWEIYEFLIDLYLNPEKPMQGGNFDTMTDLIIGAVGAALVSVLGYRFMRLRKKNFVGVMLEESVKGEEINLKS